MGLMRLRGRMLRGWLEGFLDRWEVMGRCYDMMRYDVHILGIGI